MTTTPTPTVADPLPLVRGLRSQLENIAHAARIGALELPEEIGILVRRAADLAGASDQAQRDAAAAKAESDTAARRVVAEMAESGPLASPCEAVRRARSRHEALAEDASLLHGASRVSQDNVERAVVRHSLTIIETAHQALGELLQAAHDDAAIVAPAGIDYSDAGSALAARGPVQDSYRRLAELTPAHDALRKAALGIYSLLNTASNDHAKRDRLAALDIAWLRGGGVTGPPAPGGNTADPIYSREWKWAPKGHQVARLVTAALSPAPDADPETEADQGEPSAARPIHVRHLVIE